MRTRLAVRAKGMLAAVLKPAAEDVGWWHVKRDPMPRFAERDGSELVVHRGKPDPEVFLLAASRVGVPAERCIVVEDAAAGIEGARCAACAASGYVTTVRIFRAIWLWIL